tara:strand:- start:1810 stop:2142 length:333 start_codon:yes stop_codon:yes gene_type:complete
MTLDEFYDTTKRTSNYIDAGTGTFNELAYLALGLAGESGEAADCIKKIFGMTGNSKWSELKYFEQKDKLVLELGDALWYWVRLVHALNLDPKMIMKVNIVKLQERYEDSV